MLLTLLQLTLTGRLNYCPTVYLSLNATNVIAIIFDWLTWSLSICSSFNVTNPIVINYDQSDGNANQAVNNVFL